MRTLRAGNVTRRLLVLVVGVAAGISAAGEPPDSEVNPQTGHIESVYVNQDGAFHTVWYAIDTGTGQPGRAERLTPQETDDLGARLAIDPGGAAWIVWWRAGAAGQVLYRKRDPGTGNWTAEATLSAPGEDSADPEIVHDGAATWVAYRIVGGSGTSIVVNGGSDSPEPFPGRTILATTTYAGDIELLMHDESGHLWLTWIDSDAEVAWQDYDYGTGLWSSTAYEPYANETVEDARGRIRTSVLGG
jgi:hypothetical protein